MRVRYIVLYMAVATGLYLTMWPTPVDFAAFEAEASPALTGILAPNDKLAKLKILATAGDGPEDVAVDADGTLYTGVPDGHLLVLEPGAKVWRPITLTYGRPLGLAFDASYRWLYIADAERGLMRTDKLGHLERLIDTFAGEDLGLVDDLALAPDGSIYFTSATRHWGVGDVKAAILAHERSGRLFRYQPQSRQLSLVADSLSFPNGVAISPDGRWLYVAQTADYDVLRFELDSTATVRGEASRWATQLPGFPDGLNFDGRGRLWVSLVSPRNALLDRLGPWPALREVVWRLPEQFQPQADHLMMIVALDVEGNIIDSFGGHTGQKLPYAAITNAVWRGDTLYLASLSERSLARLIVSQ